MDRLNKLIKKTTMEIIDFLKSLWGLSGIILGFTICAVIYGSYVSFKDGKTSDRIDNSVTKIDTIVSYSKKKLDKANRDLEKNIGIANANLISTDAANEKLLATNQKLGEASLQLEKNYLKTIETLNKSIEAKEEALNAKNETIKSKDEIIGQLTGGNSYPKISLKKGGFYIRVQGEYSIPKLTVLIRLIPNCFRIPKEVTIDYLRGNPVDSKYIIPVFHKTYPKLWSGFHLEKIDIDDFSNYFSTKAGSIHAIEIILESEHKRWFQRTRIASVNGKWEIADIMHEIPTTQIGNVISNDKEVFTEISDYYPSETLNLGDEIGKLVPFYNAVPSDPSKPYYPFLIYSNHHNGIGDREFNSL